MTDGDSMTINNLRDSANGTFVTLDDYLPSHVDELHGGVAQVVCHGVIVVVGHQEEGQEEKGEKQGEVEGEVEKLRDNRTSWMNQVECDE